MNYKTRLLPFLVVVLALIPLMVSMQTTVEINPTTLEYTASTDHSALGLDSQPLVARYEMRVSLESGGPVVKTLDLGKPTPVNNTITITVTQNPNLFAGLAKNARFVAVVSAIGPSGEGISEISNPFGFVGPPAAGSKPTFRK